MSHNLYACIIKGKPKQEKICSYGLQSVNLYEDLYLLSLPEQPESELYSTLDEIADDSIYAVIQTDYFGGCGEQTACVRQNKKEIMPYKTDNFGPINEALKLMGIKHKENLDEFDTVGLIKYREGFPDKLKEYEDLAQSKKEAREEKIDYRQTPTDLASWKEFVDKKIEKFGRDAILDFEFDPVSKKTNLNVTKKGKS